MKIDIYKAKWDGEKIVAVNIGYIELDKFDKDKCWELCNWSCHRKDKPDNLHSKISACCSDVAFYNPESSEYHVPDSFGWFSPVDSLDKVVKHWDDDFYTPISTKALYQHLNKTGKTFEEIYMEDK